MIYAITGATGNIGSKLAARLLAEGHKVRVIGRDADRLAGLVAQGAEAYVGDIAGSDVLSRAFSGADAVFAMLPPNYGAEDVYAAQRRNSAAVIAALQAARPAHVVALSSTGANLPADQNTGIVAGLREFEQGLAQLSGSAVKVLRPSFFLENLFGQLPVIKAAGIVAASVAPDKAIPMIATRDIAAAAAEHLLARDFSGHSADYLLGTRDYTYPQIATQLGKALNLPTLSYVQIPYGDEVAALSQAGLSPSAAQALSDLNRSVNEDVIFQGLQRSHENTTPTSFEDFLPVLVGAYQAG